MPIYMIKLSSGWPVEVSEKVYEAVRKKVQKNSAGVIQTFNDALLEVNVFVDRNGRPIAYEEHYKQSKTVKLVSVTGEADYYIVKALVELAEGKQV